MLDRKPKRQRPSHGEVLDVDDDTSGDGRYPARRHIGRACSTCRDSHNKCDGRRPECGTCRIHQRECHWSLTFDRRRKVAAPDLEQANAIITALEHEVSRLRQFCRSKGIDVDKELPPSASITVSDVPTGIGIGIGGYGGFDSTLLEGTSASSPASNGSSPWLSSIGIPSPYSMSSSLSSPHASIQGQYLDVPTGGHGRGGFSSGDLAPLSDHDGTLASHRVLPSNNVYEKTLIDADFNSMSGMTVPVHGTTTSFRMNTTGLPFVGQESTLTDDLARMTVHGNATERPDAVTIPGFPNTGEGVCTAEPATHAQECNQGPNFQLDNVAPSLLFTGVWSDASHAQSFVGSYGGNE